MVILMQGIYYGILVLIIVLALFLFKKAQSIHRIDNRLSHVILIIGINVIIFPVAFFIGTMAMASPDSNYFNFITGFFIVQGIPLIILSVSVLLKFIEKKQSSC
ncbi:MAG: hypothetical protein LPK26_10990 [Bacillaceae bacterium]|nr:hypothetical protein [Bacillaceae bacterium]